MWQEEQLFTSSNWCHLQCVPWSQVFLNIVFKKGIMASGSKPYGLRDNRIHHWIWLWQCSVTLFGLCNEPATFEWPIETVIYGLIGKKCPVYLGNVVVFGSTVENSYSFSALSLITKGCWINPALVTSLLETSVKRK